MRPYVKMRLECAVGQRAEDLFFNEQFPGFWGWVSLATLGWRLQNYA
jgi:hypothetical protein